MQKLYDLAESENIKVVEEYLPGKLKDFYFRRGKTKLICLEKRLKYINKRCVFAEELGHHFTSYGDVFALLRSNFISYGKNEYLARKWAAEFLIPEEVIKEFQSEEYFYLNIHYLAEELGVTEELLRFRWENILYTKD